MSKRGDKRRARKKKRRKPVAEPELVPTLEIGPLTIQQQGLNIVSFLDPEHPEYAEFVKHRDEFRAGLPELIEEKWRALEELLDPLPAFDALAHFQLSEIIQSAEPDALAPGPSTSLLAGMETLGAIVARRPTAEATGTADALHENTITEIQTAVRDLLTLETWSALETADPASSDDPFADLRSRALAMRIAVRGPSYPWQERETLRELFGGEAVNNDLTAAIGAGIDACLKVEAATETIGTDKLSARISAAQEGAHRLLQATDRRRQGRNVRDEATRELADRLAALPEGEAKTMVRRLATAMSAVELGRTLSFTAQEVADHAGLPAAETSRVLQLLSTPFGSEDDFARVREEFRTKPLLFDGDRYFCVSHHQMLWGLRPVLEHALKTSNRFKAYERNRRRRSEERALTALKKALRPDTAIGPVEYSPDNGDTWIELDGLLIKDNAALVLEVKASSMRDSARRAAPLALRDWLGDEVGQAANQTRRAVESLAADSHAPLRSVSGEPLAIDLGEVTRWFEVVVTLEDLSAIGPSTWRLADAGVLPRDPIPWITGLHELEVIADLIEWPAQLLHYLLRRRRVDEQRTTWAMEELDFFMYYLARGLFWEEQSNGAGQPQLVASGTDPLDAFLYHQRGLSPRKAKRPRMRVHRSVRALLDTLEGLDAAGRLEPQLLLMDVDSSAAERIASGCGQLRRSAEQLGRMRDMTLFFEESQVGVTVIACPPDQSRELRNMLQSYCTLKRHQAKYDRWIGFGCFAGPPEPAQLVYVVDSPWSPDPELDALVSDLPTAQTPAPEPQLGRTRWWRDGRWR
jgi:hypothetical protein